MWVRQLNCYLDMWYSCSATLSAVPCVLSLPLPPPHEFLFSSQFAQGSLPSQVYQGCCATCPCLVYLRGRARTNNTYLNMPVIETIEFQVYQGCCATCPCLVYLRGRAHTNKTYLNMPVIETIEFWKFLKYFNMALTQFPLKGVLRVKGVLGPRARVKGSKLKLFKHARADPGPHSPRGSLSRKIVFSVEIWAPWNTISIGFQCWFNKKPKSLMPLAAKCECLKGKEKEGREKWEEAEEERQRLGFAPFDSLAWKLRFPTWIRNMKHDAFIQTRERQSTVLVTSCEYIGCQTVMQAITNPLISSP